MAIFWSICTVVGFLTICLIVLGLFCLVLIELMSLIFEKTFVDHFYLLRNGSIAKESKFLPKLSIKKKIVKKLTISFVAHYRLVSDRSQENLIEIDPRTLVKVGVNFRNDDPVQFAEHDENPTEKIQFIIQDRIDELTLFDGGLEANFETNFSNELALIRKEFGLAYIDFTVVFTSPILTAPF